MSRANNQDASGSRSRSDEGQVVAQVCRKLGITEQTYYRRRKYGGMKVEQAKRLKELEVENGTKKILHN